MPRWIGPRWIGRDRRACDASARCSGGCGASRGASAERAHQLLGRRVPADIRYDLHVGLVSHGRTVCKAQRPRCPDCVLRDLCAFAGAGGGSGIAGLP